MDAASQRSVAQDDSSVNVADHKEGELERRFGLLTICGIATSTGDSWVALGGSLSVAIYDLGPPGVLFGLVVDSFFYWFVAASIAELASAIPSSGTVYHWASITVGPRYGRICGWFAAWWNFLGWIMGTASLSYFLALQTVAMYSTMHPALQVQNWHHFVGFVLCTWLCCSCVIFGNKILPVIESAGAFLSMAGFAITILVLTIMPRVHGRQYASSTSVWTETGDGTRWSSDGFVFCLGMLNAAFAVGAPDIPSHLAEEVPR
jgi:choline transport protein